jgi:hypothetical protein
MMTGTSPRPSSSVRIPKAKRNRPLIVSCPTVPNSRPTAAIMSVFTVDWRVK